MNDFIRVLVTEGTVLRLPAEVANKLVELGQAEYEPKPPPPPEPEPEPVEEVEEDSTEQPEEEVNDDG